MHSLSARIFLSIALVCTLALAGVGWYSSRTVFVQLESTGGAAHIPVMQLQHALERYALVHPHPNAWAQPVNAFARRYGADVLVTTPSLHPVIASWGTLHAGDVTVLPNQSIRIIRSYGAEHNELLLRGGSDVMSRGKLLARAFAFSHDVLPPPTQLAGTWTRALWISVVVAISAAIVVALLLGTYISGPVRALCDAAGAMARGDFGRRVPVRSSDDLGKLSASFNSMADAVARNDTLRRRMVSDVAHELRSPLTRLRALVESAQDGHVTAADVVDPIYRETRNLERLVDDLRDLSLADAHQLSIASDEVSLTACIEQSVRDARLLAENAGVHLLTDVAPILPLVRGDAGRLCQVLHNLLDNAIRYTPRNGHVVVGATACSKYVECFVQDDGPGIDAARLPFVFERFFRTDESRARSTGGTGLGLAIVKEIVAAHGGTVNVECVPSQGARFTFRLPLISAARANVPPRPDWKESGSCL